MAKYRNELSQTTDIFKALSDEQRLRALMALLPQELCVCQLVELLGLAPSTVSKHMSILKQVGLVESRKDGRWVFYRLKKSTEEPGIPDVIEWLLRALQGETLCCTLKQDEQIMEDKKRLREILKMDPEDLCRKQCSC